MVTQLQSGDGFSPPPEQMRGYIVGGHNSYEWRSISVCWDTNSYARNAFHSDSPGDSCI